ncbi:hypothetical protein [Novipirellula sp.]|uniref:hypothetical protein n=1 Tax=Novipirellula sp. TaxID=2795430 RepID=UPI003561B8C3
MTEPNYNSHWQSFLNNAGGDLWEKLWASAICTIARHQLEAEGVEPSDDWEERFEHYEEAVEDMVENRVHQWLSRSIPHNAKLVNWLGGYDYFQEWEVSWRETFCFAGDACHCPGDIAETMRTRIPSYVATEEEITEEVVEDFFVEWRAHFFHRVAQEAEKSS